jgi:hypothetical protein
VIGNLGVGLGFGTDVGPNTAVVQQVDVGAQDRADQAVAVERIGLALEGRARLGTELDPLEAALVDSASLADQRRIVIRPSRVRQVEEAAPLGEARVGIGVGIYEDMTMVEGGNELEVVRLQKTVAENVTRHVADSDHRDRRAAMRVPPHLTQMALGRFPRAARRDAERLVVVPVHPARCERIAEPETSTLRYAIGNVRKRGCALVGCYHKVRIVAVEHFHALGMHHVAADEIVGQLEHRVDQGLVREDDLLMRRLAAASRLDDEAALAADRHDDRVLDRLRLHQLEDFGAEIVGTVAETDSAARDLAGAQMTSFHPRAVHVDFVQRRDIGQVENFRALEFESEVRVRGRLRQEIVASYCRLDHREDRSRGAVIGDVVDVDERFQVRRAQPFGVVGTVDAIRIEPDDEEIDQYTREFGMEQQHTIERRTRGRELHLKPSGQVGAHQGDLAPCEIGGHRERIQRIVLGAPAYDCGQGLGDQPGAGWAGNRFVLEATHAERLHESGLRLLLAGVGPHLMRVLGDHLQTEILQQRHQLGENWRDTQLVHPKLAHALGPVADRTDFDVRAARLEQRLNALDVGDRPLDAGAGLVIRREGIGPSPSQLLRTLCAQSIIEFLLQSIAPGSRKPLNLGLERRKQSR